MRTVLILPLQLSIGLSETGLEAIMGVWHSQAQDARTLNSHDLAGTIDRCIRAPEVNKDKCPHIPAQLAF